MFGLVRWSQWNNCGTAVTGPDKHFLSGFKIQGHDGLIPGTSVGIWLRDHSVYSSMDTMLNVNSIVWDL